MMCIECGQRDAGAYTGNGRYLTSCRLLPEEDAHVIEPDGIREDCPLLQFILMDEEHEKRQFQEMIGTP